MQTWKLCPQCEATAYTVQAYKGTIALLTAHIERLLADIRRLKNKRKKRRKKG